MEAPTEEREDRKRGERSGLVILVFVLASVVAGLGVWHTREKRKAGPILVTREPRGIMGTSCRLQAVVDGLERDVAERGLDAAEAALREVEALMSTWLEDSEISRFNAAQVRVLEELSPLSLEILEAARAAWEQSGGAFDVTCRPLIELWREAGERGVMPADDELRAAREASRWMEIELHERGALKLTPGVRVDLGGIAKGFAIDRAHAALLLAGVQGGLIDVGGDVFTFGLGPVDSSWAIDVRDPAGGLLGRLQGSDVAVCTSGNYARFVEIEGHRFSHIIDPRTGRPADAVPSVTVVAPTTLEADTWATALSVLGVGGLSLLPEDIDAWLVLETGPASRMVCTRGMLRWIDGTLPPTCEVR